MFESVQLASDTFRWFRRLPQNTIRRCAAPAASTSQIVLLQNTNNKNDCFTVYFLCRASPVEIPLPTYNYILFSVQIGAHSVPFDTSECEIYTL